MSETVRKNVTIINANGLHLRPAGLFAELAGKFDAVVEHTCLCALNPVDRKAYVQSVRKLLKPGVFGIRL